LDWGVLCFVQTQVFSDLKGTEDIAMPDVPLDPFKVLL